MNRLEGRVAVVTGGAGGHGAAEAAVFAREGARVVVADVAEQAGRTVADELGPAVEFVRLDVSEEEGWTRLVEEVMVRHGRLDVLVNNAARYWARPLMEESVADLDAITAVNLRGPFLGIRAVSPRMRDGGGGSIVNVSSTAGVTGYPGHGAYGMTKWALRGLTKVAAAELAPWGIRVNCLVPGAIEGAMLASSVPDDVVADPGHWAGTPLRRAGRPSEVAAAALFLACADSSYVTGTELVVDGGSTGTG